MPNVERMKSSSKFQSENFNGSSMTTVRIFQFVVDNFHTICVRIMYYALLIIIIIIIIIINARR
jgi:hypothetical protein